MLMGRAHGGECNGPSSMGRAQWSKHMGRVHGENKLGAVSLNVCPMERVYHDWLGQNANTRSGKSCSGAYVDAASNVQQAILLPLHPATRRRSTQVNACQNNPSATISCLKKPACYRNQGAGTLVFRRAGLPVPVHDLIHLVRVDQVNIRVQPDMPDRQPLHADRALRIVNVLLPAVLQANRPLSRNLNLALPPTRLLQSLLRSYRLPEFAPLRRHNQMHSDALERADRYRPAGALPPAAGARR